MDGNSTNIRLELSVLKKVGNTEKRINLFSVCTHSMNFQFNEDKYLYISIGPKTNFEMVIYRIFFFFFKMAQAYPDIITQLCKLLSSLHCLQLNILIVKVESR